MSRSRRPGRQQFQGIQDRILKAQEGLAEKTVETTVGGGAVRVVMNGQQELQQITIAPEVVDPEDIEMLQDLIVAAVNEAINQTRDLVQQSLQESMGGLLGGLGLSDLF